MCSNTFEMPSHDIFLAAASEKDILDEDLAVARLAGKTVSELNDICTQDALPQTSFKKKNRSFGLNTKMQSSYFLQNKVNKSMQDITSNRQTLYMLPNKVNKSYDSFLHRIERQFEKSALLGGYN